MKEYKDYKKGELEQIYNSLSKVDKGLIEKFIKYCSVGAQENKLKDIKRSLVQFRDITQKPLNKLKVDDLRGFLITLNKSNREKYTRNGIKQHIKRFLKFSYKDWFERFEEFRDIKLDKAFNEKKINSSTMLDKEDIELIMKKEMDIMKKAFFITLYESGCRPIELRTLKWKDISLNTDGDISELKIFATKTQKFRSVFVKESTFYLLKLWENKQSEFIFYSRENKNAPISKATASLWLKAMGKNVKLEIFPYLLRHSRATQLYRRAREGEISKDNVQQFMGHSGAISELYTHLDESEVKEMMKNQIYNFNEIPEDKKSEYEERIKHLEEKLTKIQNHLEMSRADYTQMSKLISQLVRQNLKGKFKNETDKMVAEHEFLKSLK